ncbi:hypothetical protein TIFTF001_009269 [Ficus carica]|uniref:Uncharacterized protein n=1 Tax=Ficus carica TaxID=3494 RepID=A0AA88DHE6_FICCA|nr:hypothetical protein TIFTF001_009269 [Ficus carica]
MADRDEMVEWDPGMQNITVRSSWAVDTTRQLCQAGKSPPTFVFQSSNQPRQPLLLYMGVYNFSTFTTPESGTVLITFLFQAVVWRGPILDCLLPNFLFLFLFLFLLDHARTLTYITYVG